MGIWEAKEVRICAHTLVKNEEKYLWFAVASIAPYLDKILLWDTGSTDDTVKIIKELSKKFPGKIDFNEVGDVDINKFTSVRQEMLNKTKGDWVLIVDGDEVWWDEHITAAVNLIRTDGVELDSVGCRFFNLVGDIYHFQDESAGNYRIDDNIGHLTIRGINTKIDGLHFGKPHGQQGIFDSSETLIQDLPKSRRFFVDEKAYLHFTHLIRSKSSSKDSLVPKRNIKLKHEIGIDFPFDFYYPEVFFREKPEIVSSPWQRMSSEFYYKSSIQTPFRKIKRKLYSPSSGY